MQTLYTLTSAIEPGDNEALKKAGNRLLDDKLSHSIDLLAVAILYVFRVAQYADTDARHRSSKYLTTDEDLNVSTKIVNNEFLLQVLSNPSFSKKVKESKVEQYINEEWIRKIYLQLAQTPEYKTYIAAEGRTAAIEKDILQFIWEKLLWGNEELQENFTEELPGWEDDKEMTGMLMENFFKNSAKINFMVPLAEEKNKYAHDLLNTVIDKEDYCMDLIKPKLAHWDTERIAVVDLLLLRMGVSELLWFPTIPTKVTINEYIEIAKVYSTPQSGNFVNGVLDNILKDLEKDNKIKKQDRTRK